MQVPEGWEKVRLDKVAEIRTGVAKSRKKIIDPIDVPYLRVANVQDGHINLDEVKTITIERHQLERYSLVAGDVLMNEGGDFDKLGRGDVWQGQIEPCLHQNHVFSVRPNQKKLNSHFLAALAASHYGKIYFLSCAKRSTNLASINSTQVKQFPVLVPPLEEQQKIAQILSTWDKAITTTEQLLANSQQQKKALMQQLLTGAHPSKPRLLDDNGQRFSGEWEFKTISQMGKVLSGGTPDTNSAEYWDGSINWLTPTDVTALKSRFVEETARKISSEGVKNSSAKLLPAGSLMVCTRATIGALAISTSEICTNQGFKNIVPGKGFDVNFIYYLLLNNIKEFVRKASGSTFLEISKKDFENVKLLCPELQEQQKIATVLTAADNEITQLQQKLDQLKQEKKALMQQLLTGKRRVKVEEVA